MVFKWTWVLVFASVTLADIFWRYSWFNALALFGSTNLKVVLLTTLRTFVAFSTLEYKILARFDNAQLHLLLDFWNKLIFSSFCQFIMTLIVKQVFVKRKTTKKSNCLVIFCLHHLVYIRKKTIVTFPFFGKGLSRMDHSLSNSC